MSVTRGFVQKIDVGRAGLVQVTLIHEDTSTGVYVIRDLDGDPERFNERLSQLGVLRDAMNRAEPVEIEHQPREGANEINRAVRITRDELKCPLNTATVSGLVVSVTVFSQQGIEPGGTETADHADVFLFVPGAGLRNFRLGLQNPERLVAAEQLRLLLDAEAGTRAVALMVEYGSAGTPPRILAVAAEDAEAILDSKDGTEVSGFVETLSLIRITTGGAVAAATFAHVRFTTAPDFTGPGNTVANSPFVPTTLELLVPKNSLVYKLFEAGLRDNLRMRVRTRDLTADRNPAGGTRPTPSETPATGSAPASPGALSHRVRILEAAATAPPGQAASFLLVVGAELLAPIASASRPVWINIERDSLDRGPECDCAEGVPSSDLSAKTLRDLKIPYRAIWKGLGCFNSGVYRIQIEADVALVVKLDGEKLCIHDSSNPKVKFAYACLCGEHLIEVVLDDWICDKEFLIDVYRLR